MPEQLESIEQQTWREFCKASASRYEAEAALLASERARIACEWERFRAYCGKVMVRGDYDIAQDAIVYHVRIGIVAALRESPYWRGLCAEFADRARAELLACAFADKRSPEPLRLLLTPSTPQFLHSAAVPHA